MYVYKDAIDESPSEILSDMFTISEVDDIVYEVNCPLVPRSSYPVCEEDAQNEDDEEKFNAVTNYFELIPIRMDRDTYTTRMKSYARHVKNYLISQGTSQQEISAFQRNFQAYFKDKILPNFDNFDLYISKEYTDDGMVILLDHREDGTPYLIYWKHGLEAIQC